MNKYIKDIYMLKLNNNHKINVITFKYGMLYSMPSMDLDKKILERFLLINEPSR